MTPDRISRDALRQKLEAELARYPHHLVEFAVDETAGGTLELVIRLKQPIPGEDEYRAAIHPRDVEGPQFSWNLQRFLYGCLHDYVIDLFIRTPQYPDTAGGDAR
jgi:hypothetical protein